MSKLIIKSAVSSFVAALRPFGHRRQVSGREFTQELPRKLPPTRAKENRLPNEPSYKIVDEQDV
jgi:hypothetical protein